MIRQFPQLIDKAFIQQLFAFSQNIDNVDIEHHIVTAQMMAFDGVVGDDLANAVLAAANLNVKRWNRTTAYGVGDKVEYNGKYYQATTANTNVEPIAPIWVAVEILNFWADYVRPFIAAEAVRSFYVYAGANVSPQGIRVGIEPTSIEATDKRRSELIADVKARKSFYQTQMLNYLASVSWVLDGVDYSADNCGKVSVGSSFGLIAPKFRER